MRVTIQVRVSPEGNAELLVQDLTGDRWRDYLAELEEAHNAQSKGDHVRRNRSIRNALHALHAHLEGVVNPLWELATGQSAGKSEAAKFSLRAKIRSVREHAARVLQRRLPAFTLRLKAIRDAITHPGTGDDLAVLRLTLHEIRQEGDRIAHWLTRACEAYGKCRIEDTEAIIEKFAPALGKVRRLAKI